MQTSMYIHLYRHRDPEFDAMGYWEPVQLLENGSDVLSPGSQCEEPGS